MTEEAMQDKGAELFGNIIAAMDDLNYEERVKLALGLINGLVTGVMADALDTSEHIADFETAAMLMCDTESALEEAVEDGLREATGQPYICMFDIDGPDDGGDDDGEPVPEERKLKLVRVA